MKLFLIHILLVLSVCSVFAQEDFSRIDRSGYSDADFFFYQRRYEEAYDILKELHITYPDNSEVAYRLAVCELDLFRNKDKAQELLESALQRGKRDALFYLAKISHLNHEFDQAMELFTEYKTVGSRDFRDSEIDRHIDQCREAKRLTAFPEDILVKNMGSQINSEYAEYVPVITSDESELYFTSRRDNSTGGKTDPNNRYFEDIYMSKKEGDTWVKPTNVISEINTETHDATAAISADGSKMVIYRTNRQLTGGDLYITQRVNDKWSEPELLDYNINSDFQEASACFSPDGNTLYFSSNRPGGFGGRDIYRVRILPNGDWSLPMNLGSAINTEFNEDSPFLDVDDRTLYFASEGHNSMGGFDIFISKRRGAENWSIPENLGFPANSVEDDIYLSITPGGKKGYYSSEKENGYGDQDLYEVEFIYRQQTNIIVKGVLTNDFGKPVQGEITVIDETTKDLLGVYTSNERTGKFILLLNPMTKYNITVQSPGKGTYSKELYYEFPEENNKEIELEAIMLK
ncbi:MAG: tetratricopeptide repeat protein [Flavobacteriales bacterium]